MVKARGYQECCNNYKVVIMDFEMPVMNGIEVILLLTHNLIFLRQQRRLDSIKRKEELTKKYSL
jgi:CheY-like chemotaxis protein